MEQDGTEQSTQLLNLILISIIKMNIIQSYIRAGLEFQFLLACQIKFDDGYIFKKPVILSFI